MSSSTTTTKTASILRTPSRPSEINTETSTLLPPSRIHSNSITSSDPNADADPEAAHPHPHAHFSTTRTRTRFCLGMILALLVVGSIGTVLVLGGMRLSGGGPGEGKWPGGPQ